MGSQEPPAEHGRSGRVVIPETAVWQVVEERVVILELDGSQYFRLDAVGSRMWGLLDELGDIETVHARLADEYEVDASQLRQDLEEFVSELATAGLLVVEPAAS
jgi:hypothetical protein